MKFYRLSLLLLIAVTFFFELVLRNDFVMEHLPLPDYGSENSQLDTQIARLERVVQLEGAVDCFFIGDSLVWFGVNPVVFSQAFELQTGNKPTCFDFGVASMPAAEAAKLARILKERYHPRFIIYGIHASALVIPETADEAVVIREAPWIVHHSGGFSIKGFLYSSSSLLRYRTILAKFLRFENNQADTQLGDVATRNLGHDVKVGSVVDLTKPLDLNDAAIQIGLEKYYDYRIFPENLEGVKNFIQLGDQNTAVGLFIMPVSESFYQFFKNGRLDYLTIISEIEQIAIDFDAYFLPGEAFSKIPTEDWWDYSHLNEDGAVLFSSKLGQIIGYDVQMGQFPIPVNIGSTSFP